MQRTAVSKTPATKTWSPQDRPAKSTAIKPIDLVVPFTDMAQAQSALRYAARLCSGMEAAVRVLRVVQVPYALDVDHPAVPVSFIEDQLASLQCELPVTFDVRLTRDRAGTLVSAIADGPLVLLVSKRRLWRTREERLAKALKRAGCNVLLSYETGNHA